MLHAVGDGTFVADGRKFDRRKQNGEQAARGSRGDRERWRPAEISLANPCTVPRGPDSAGKYTGGNR